MTAQFMDQFELEGITWSICGFSGGALAPASEDLGFSTGPEHTANYRGRVDRFRLDEHGVLHLLEIRATLDEGSYRRCATPPGATREVEDERTCRFKFAAFPLSGSGTFVLGHDLDRAFYVHGGIQRANRFRRRAILELEGGRLVAARFEDGSSRDPPPTLRDRGRNAVAIAIFLLVTFVAPAVVIGSLARSCAQ